MTVRQYDHNGWFEVQRNPLSKAGVFAYTKKSTQYPGWEADPTGLVMVYRPESELADPDAVKSFRLLPWINDHTMLGNPEDAPGLVAPEEKGVHGTTGEQIEYDPSDRTLYGNLKLWSRSLADAVDAGKKQLSMGFRCVYEFVTGEFEGQPFQAIQRKIRGNHPASVDLGRMGPGVAVLDSMLFGFDAAELRELPVPNKVQRRVNVAAKLGVSPTALLSHFGLDAADDAVKKAFNLAMDAEEDAAAPEGGSGDISLQDLTDTFTEAAKPLGELMDAINTMAGGGSTDPGDDVSDPGADDDMEPVIDAATGAQKMDAQGKPMFQKKAAAPVTDKSPGLGIAADKGMVACDAAITSAELQSKAAHRSLKGRAAPAALTAFDAAIANVKAARAKITKKPKPKTGSGMDAAIAGINKRLDTIQAGTPSIKSVMADIASRDTLYKQVSPFVGAFDHAEMTAGDLAVYACDKLEIKAPKGQEITALNGFLTGRSPAPAKPGFGFDAAITGQKPVAAVSDYISGDSR